MQTSKIQLVKLTSGKDHGYRELMSRALPIWTKYLTCNNGEEGADVVINTTRGFTLGYLNRGILYGSANFAVSELDKANLKLGQIDHLRVWRKGNQHAIAERILISLIRIVSEEYPQIGHIRSYVRNNDEATRRLYARSGFISSQRSGTIIHPSDGQELMILKLHHQ